MKFFQKKTLFLAVFLTFFLTSCIETVIVGSTATGVLVTQKKTISKTGKDALIITKITAEFIKKGLKTPGNSIDANVEEGRVLLTGIARNVQKANLASELAWKIDGVKEVIDEIQLLDDGLHFRDFSKGFIDYVITAEVETRLLFAKKIPSINYQITTVSKIVYVLGVANDKEEMNKVLSIVARTRGVEKVINHVILSGDSRRNG